MKPRVSAVNNFRMIEDLRSHLSPLHRIETGESIRSPTETIIGVSQKGLPCWKKPKENVSLVDITALASGMIRENDSVTTDKRWIWTTQILSHGKPG